MPTANRTASKQSSKPRNRVTHRNVMAIRKAKREQRTPSHLRSCFAMRRIRTIGSRWVPSGPARNVPIGNR